MNARSIDIEIAVHLGLKPVYVAEYNDYWYEHPLKTQIQENGITRDAQGVEIVMASVRVPDYHSDLNVVVEVCQEKGFDITFHDDGRVVLTYRKNGEYHGVSRQDYAISIAERAALALLAALYEIAK